MQDAIDYLIQINEETPTEIILHLRGDLILRHNTETIKHLTRYKNALYIETENDYEDIINIDMIKAIRILEKKE